MNTFEEFLLRLINNIDCHDCDNCKIKAKCELMNKFISDINKLDIDKYSKQIAIALVKFTFAEETYVLWLENSNNTDKIINDIINNNISVNDIVNRWSSVIDEMDKISEIANVLSKEIKDYIYNIINRYITISKVIVYNLHRAFDKENVLLDVFKYKKDKDNVIFSNLDAKVSNILNKLSDEDREIIIKEFTKIK